jgi:hypothetical protein
LWRGWHNWACLLHSSRAAADREASEQYRSALLGDKSPYFTDQQKLLEVASLFFLLFITTRLTSTHLTCKAENKALQATLRACKEREEAGRAQVRQLQVGMHAMKQQQLQLHLSQRSRAVLPPGAQQQVM